MIHSKNYRQKRRPLIEKIAFNYLSKLSLVEDRNTHEPHLLNVTERKEIKKIYNNTLFYAALFGVLGVLCLYLPTYYWQEVFYDHLIYFPIINKELPVPIITTLYGLVLLYIELYALSAVNLTAVYKIAKVCGFPPLHDPKFNDHIEALMRVGLEKNDKTSQSYGINPLQGVSKVRLFLFLLINRLKGTITNYAAKFIIKGLLGRVALRQVIDMTGIPVYAFWNAYAAHLVIHETKIRIMAPYLIQYYATSIHQRYGQNDEFRGMIYETLQFIAISKRKYHHNHFLLAEEMLRKFNIPLVHHFELAPGYLERVIKLSPDVRLEIVKFMALGFIIDGDFSIKERTAINKLHKQNIIPFGSKEVDLWAKRFINGEGLEGFF
ncbi:MAG: hypothetical protein NZ529_05915 [Cytophagaceae bacterium]|nr:hypothetical protein [Cytophagaceae bacterium]MDW8456314.1 hypothetical protein [Cytophagaceae bacterium]